MCFCFADVGDIQSRLIDHRPVINSEIRYLVKEFEVVHVTLWRMMNRIKFHFIRPTVLVKGWTLQLSFSSFSTVAQVWESWHVQHREKPYQIIYDENLLFHHTPKVIYWIEIWKFDTSQDGPMLPCCLHSEPKIWMLRLKWGLVRPGALFWSSIVLSWQEEHRVVSCCCSSASSRFQMLGVLHSLFGTSGFCELQLLNYGLPSLLNPVSAPFWCWFKFELFVWSLSTCLKELNWSHLIRCWC